MSTPLARMVRWLGKSAMRLYTDRMVSVTSFLLSRCSGSLTSLSISPLGRPYTLPSSRRIGHPALPGRFDVQLHLVDALMQVLPHIFAPKPENGVARFDKRGIDFFIPLDITLEFRDPEVAVTLDSPLGLFPLVAVPELAIHEDNQPVFADNDIRPAGQVFGVDAVADALCPKRLAQQQLGLGIFGPDAAHVIRALRGSGEMGHKRKDTEKLRII